MRLPEFMQCYMAINKLFAFVILLTVFIASAINCPMLGSPISLPTSEKLLGGGVTVFLCKVVKAEANGNSSEKSLASDSDSSTKNLFGDFVARICN